MLSFSNTYWRAPNHAAPSSFPLSGIRCCADRPHRASPGYHPGWLRNLNTTAPLAQARGRAVQRISLENPVTQLMSEGAGKTIVWIGNKGNLHSIWGALAAPEPPPLNYGDLYIVERGKSGSPEVTRQHFGP